MISERYTVNLNIRKVPTDFEVIIVNETSGTYSPKFRKTELLKCRKIVAVHEFIIYCSTLIIITSSNEQPVLYFRDVHLS